jgi:hypothetical protein
MKIQLIMTRMKNRRSLNAEKKYESIFSIISDNNILNLNQMVSVRGGEGNPDPIVTPPTPPRKTETITLDFNQ